MEHRAPLSRVVRARERRAGGVDGVGTIALRANSSCLAVVRREATLEGRGRARSWERVDSRLCVEAVIFVVVSGDVMKFGGGGGVEGSVMVEVAAVRKVIIRKLLRKALMPSLRSGTRKVCRRSDPPQE